MSDNGITDRERRKIIGFIVAKIAEYRRHELNSDQATAIAIQQEQKVFERARTPAQYDHQIDIVISGIIKGVI